MNVTINSSNISNNIPIKPNEAIGNKPEQSSNIVNHNSISSTPILSPPVISKVTMATEVDILKIIENLIKVKPQDFLPTFHVGEGEHRFKNLIKLSNWDIVLISDKSDSGKSIQLKRDGSTYTLTQTNGDRVVALFIEPLQAKSILTMMNQKWDKNAYY